MDNEPKKKRDAIETYNLAYQACGELWFGEQTTPTILMVCERIHKKHTAVVGRAIKAWKEDVSFEDLLNRRRTEIKHSSKPPNAALEPDFGQAVAELYRKAKTQALLELQERENALEQERVRLQEEITATQTAYQTIQKEWAAYRIGTEREIDVLREQNLDLARALQEQGKVVEHMRDEREHLLDKIARKEEAQTSSEYMLTALGDAHQDELRRWKERFDLDHDWHLQRIAEEKNIIRSGIQAQLDNLAARIRMLEPEAVLAAELRWEVKLKSDAIARLQQDNETLRRSLDRLDLALILQARGYRQPIPAVKNEVKQRWLNKRLPGFWRHHRQFSRPDS